MFYHITAMISDSKKDEFVSEFDLQKDVVMKDFVQQYAGGTVLYIDGRVVFRSQVKGIKVYTSELNSVDQLKKLEKSYSDSDIHLSPTKNDLFDEPEHFKDVTRELMREAGFFGK